MCVDLRFQIDPMLIGLAIGKQGSRIKDVQSMTGANIAVNGDTGAVVIIGPTTADVARAKELMDISREVIYLTDQQIEWFSRVRVAGCMKCWYEHRR
jgi:polyribonucleotide nucleotidyltransferase